MLRLGLLVAVLPGLQFPHEFLPVELIIHEELLQGFLLFSERFAVDQVGDCLLPQEVVLVLQILEFWVGGFEFCVPLSLEFCY